jgi:hypothetical protein
MSVVKSLEYLDIIWDEGSKSQITSWKGGFQNRNIREGLDTALEEFKKIIKKTPNAQWIGDTKEIGVIGREDQEWINTNWFPRFLATGVKYMAVIVPSSVIAKMSVNSIVSKVEGTNLTSKYFSSLEDAKKWIIEMTK